MANKQPKRIPRPGIDEYGRAELHNAVIDHDLPRVRLLLASGANPNLPDDSGWTPLHFAAQERQATAAEELLAAGAEVDSTNEAGNTPLWVAVMFNSGKEIVKLLLAHGADPDRENKHGITPRELVQGTDDEEFLTLSRRPAV